MSSVLGVILLVVYVSAIVALAAAITYLVIRISPTRDKPKQDPAPDA